MSGKSSKRGGPQGKKKHDLRLRASAARKLKKIRGEDRGRLFGAIERLRHDPFLAGSTALKEAPGYRRIRVGSWRIVYTVIDHVIEVAIIGHRKDAYDALSQL